MSDFDYIARNLGPVKPEARAIAHEIFDAAAAAGHEIWAMWGYDPDKNNTEHYSGLALDLMVKNSAAGTWIRNYVWANRERLRLRHVIWAQHITSTVTQPGVVRLMEDRGSTTNNHYDHNHVLLFPGTYQPPNGGSNPSTGGGGKSISEVAGEVIAGEWGNGDDRVSRLRSAGYDPSAVQAEVNRRLGGGGSVPTKSVSQLASEVLSGQWGNGADRKGRLTEAGYDYDAVQAEVNRRVNGGKTVSQLATEVLQGKWGNGDDRRRRLTQAGYDYNAVQREVNRRV